MPNASTPNAAQNRWQQLEPVALRRWELLAPEDLDTVRGNTERMLTLLQRRYGYDRDKAIRELAAWSRALREAAPVAVAAAR